MEMDTDAEGEDAEDSGEETDREAAAVEDENEDTEEETTEEEVEEEAPDAEAADEDALDLGPEGGPIAGDGRDLGRRSRRRADSWRFTNFIDADEMTSDEAWQRRVTVSFTSSRDWPTVVLVPSSVHQSVHWCGAGGGRLGSATDGDGWGRSKDGRMCRGIVQVRAGFQGSLC